MRRLALVLLVLALAVGAYAAGAASRRPRDPRGPRGLPVAGRAAPPSIVLVVLDTLRADATRADTTTAGLASLRAFGATATTFTGAVAPSSWTLPSVASLLTGLAPSAHGVMDLATNARLAPAVPSLARLLRDAGYATAACTAGGWVAPESGLAEGFDQFETDFDRVDPTRAVVRAVRAADSTRPLFLWLHSYVCHDPYGEKRRVTDGGCAGVESDLVAPLGEVVATRGPFGGELRQRFLLEALGDPCRHAALGARLGSMNVSTLWVERCFDFSEGAWRDEPGGAATVDGLRAAYRRALGDADRRLAAVLDAVEGLPPDTVVVVCGDHGEMFGEHGPIHHGRYLYPEVVRVPLVVRAPGLPGGVVPGTCSLLDLAPLLLDLARAAPPPRLDGESLAGIAGGARRRRPAPSFVGPGLALGGAATRDLRRLTLRDDDVAWSGTYDVRTGAWPEERWFRLATDPDEQAPLPTPPALAPGFAEELARLKAEVASRYRGPAGR